MSWTGTALVVTIPGMRTELHTETTRALNEAASVILGKPEQIRLAFCALFAQGHLLIEDVPGVGKTTLAQTLARLCGLDYGRVQFTSDLLPADVLGISIFHRDSGEFRWQNGPIFTQVLLADELNRASPKTQSALLEAMEERAVTADGKTRALPEPFFVIATQNPLDQIGTFALPESQLDRFLLRLSLGYPDEKDERELLAGADRRQVLHHLSPVLTPAMLMEIQQAVTALTTSPALIAYIHALISASRSSADIRLGLSPRAGLAIRRAAQAWAWLHERDHVLPEDVQAVFVPCAAHRLQARQAQHGRHAGEALANALLTSVAVP